MSLPLGQTVSAINQQVLSLINQYARRDAVQAQVLFGLPAWLAETLARADTAQLLRLSRTPLCLLTLRNCGDEQYWLRLVRCSEHDTEPHLLNLDALCLAHAGNNRLYAHDGEPATGTPVVRPADTIQDRVEGAP